MKDNGYCFEFVSSANQPMKEESYQIRLITYDDIIISKEITSLEANCYV